MLPARDDADSFASVSVSYDAIADAYDHAYDGPPFQREDRMVARLLAESLPAGGRVLDIGCGTGKALELLPPCDYVGIDIAARMVAVARAKHPGADFRVGSATALPYADGVFDAVVSTYGSLSHVEDLDLALAEAVRVLRAGGVLFLMFYGVAAQVAGPSAGTRVVDYRPRCVEMPPASGIPAWLYSSRDLRRIVRRHVALRWIRGLTVLGGGSGTPVRDTFDRLLTIIRPDWAHTVCVLGLKVN
ncbi:class I SAM-dependent methyltransferase [Promicromonospora sp. NPDC023805]|uniref:class I SAM-dependent methyltransferase n=1 Tax=Promicromonospora sp. NPDC023805 TaxID=3154696 RepID=UPI0033E71B1D